MVLSFLVVFSVLVNWMLRSWHRHPAEWGNWIAVVCIVIETLIQAIFVAFAAGIITAFFWGPIHERRASINGAPFQKGDRVRILVGKYRDRVVVVRGRGPGITLRVDSGEGEQDSIADCFFPYQLLSEDDPGWTSLRERPLPPC